MNIDDTFPKFDVMKRTLDLERAKLIKPAMARGVVGVNRVKITPPEFGLIMMPDGRTVQSRKTPRSTRLTCSVCHVFVETPGNCDVNEFKCLCTPKAKSIFDAKVGDLVRYRGPAKLMDGAVFRISDKYYGDSIPLAALRNHEHEAFEPRAGDWYISREQKPEHECYLVQPEPATMQLHGEQRWSAQFEVKNWPVTPDGRAFIELTNGYWRPVLGKVPKK